MAVGDGRDYVKYEGNPVITVKDIPVSGSSEDFRDPKIWQEDDGKFYAVAAGAAGDGPAIFFCSEARTLSTGNS